MMGALILITVCLANVLTTINAECCKCDCHLGGISNPYSQLYSQQQNQGVSTRYHQIETNNLGFSRNLQQLAYLKGHEQLNTHHQLYNINQDYNHINSIQNLQQQQQHHLQSQLTEQNLGVQQQKSYVSVHQPNHYIKIESTNNHHQEDTNEHHELDHHHKKDKNIHYKFEYAVNDHKTHDIKKHQEERSGDVVKGEYSLVEDGGNVRTVKYYADWKTGFHAQVLNSKNTPLG